MVISQYKSPSISSYTIKKHGHSSVSMSSNYSISLKDKQYSNILYNSIIKSLNKISSSFLFIDNVNNELFFQANTIYNLLEYMKQRQHEKQNNGILMDYEQSMYMIACLSEQILYLKNNHFSFLGFDLQDIIIINNNIFFIATNQYLVPFNNINMHGYNYNHISLLSPFVKPYFSSPEILEITKLPAFIHYKSCYYSLAALVIYCLLDEYLFKGNEIKNEHEVDILLQPIFSSKMYWFLKRCLYNDYEKRSLLFI
jgi:hypothetical protein